MRPREIRDQVSDHVIIDYRLMSNSSHSAQSIPELLRILSHEVVDVANRVLVLGVDQWAAWRMASSLVAKI